MSQYLLDRMREASTWRGLVLVATACGAIVSPEQADAIVSLGLLAAGLLATFTADKLQPPKEQAK